MTHTPQLSILLQDVARRGLDLMDELLPQCREELQRHAGQTHDPRERELRRQAFLQLVQVSPDLRQRFPEVLHRAFARELEGDPATTTFETAPVSIRFEQLELMDEQQVQQRISRVRGVQQVLQEAEAELAELNALLSSMMGFAQVRSERNPLRPEVFLDALEQLLGELPGGARSHALWAQSLLPLLGRRLRPLYRDVLARLRQQNVRPARYVISQPAHPAAGSRVPAGRAVPPAVPPAPASADARLTVQQLHGLMSGSAPDAQQLAQEVVNLLIANIAGDPRVPPPVWQLIYELEPALLQLARSDLAFFHDKQHPARLLLEDIVQHSFAFDSEDAPEFEAFLDHLRLALHEIDPSRVTGPEPFAQALQRLRRHREQDERVQQTRREAAVQALQQAERRNELARQIADYIRKQPGTVLVPDAVVAFACGPWAQVMAQTRLENPIEGPGDFDPVALLEDLFWSVRPDQTRQQSGELVRIIPQLIQGLRQGLARIHYPEAQTGQFFSQLLTLHQGGMQGMSAARSLRVGAAPAPARTWLAPEEARDSGFMDDLGGEADDARSADFAATEPAAFPVTEPMGLEARVAESMPSTLQEEAPAPAPLSLEQLSPGSWLELQVEGHWLRMQLSWLNEPGTLCLLTSGKGSNHSMTRRMFERLVAGGELRLVSQGAVVERAFDAVAELAMRNSVYMALQDVPPS